LLRRVASLVPAIGRYPESPKKLGPSPDGLFFACASLTDPGRSRLKDQIINNYGYWQGRRKMEVIISVIALFYGPVMMSALQQKVMRELKHYRS
jgi:hypothetical protein